MALGTLLTSAGPILSKIMHIFKKTLADIAHDIYNLNDIHLTFIITTRQHGQRPQDLVFISLFLCLSKVMVNITKSLFKDT